MKVSVTKRSRFVTNGCGARTVAARRSFKSRASALTERKTQDEKPKMKINERETNGGHEFLLTCSDEETGYRGVIAIHSTALGPAVGGTRFWNYASESDAITDALRLARGMTYKNAAAGLPLGGSKSVIIGDYRTLER